MAQGLNFSLSHYPEGSLKGCEDTIRFCKTINDMFDALNCKTSNQGLRSESNDFKVFKLLDVWRLLYYTLYLISINLDSARSIVHVLAAL